MRELFNKAKSRLASRTSVKLGRALLSTFRVLLPLLLVCSLSVGANAQVFVITHTANSNQDLSKRQVVNIFMGRSKIFPSGDMATPLDLSADSHVRADFYKALTGKSLPQISAYWARLLFTGRHTPPMVMNDDDALANFLESNISAVAYTDDPQLASRFKVVFELDP